VINPAFVASLIASLDELQLAYPDVREILVDGQSVLPTVQIFHKAEAEMSKFDRQVLVKNLLKIVLKHIAKLQLILHGKSEKGRNLSF